MTTTVYLTYKPKDDGQPQLLIGIDCNRCNTFCFYCQLWVLAILAEHQEKSYSISCQVFPNRILVVFR